MLLNRGTKSKIQLKNTLLKGNAQFILLWVLHWVKVKPQVQQKISSWNFFINTNRYGKYLQMLVSHGTKPKIKLKNTLLKGNAQFILLWVLHWVKVKPQVQQKISSWNFFINTNRYGKYLQMLVSHGAKPKKQLTNTLLKVNVQFIFLCKPQKSSVNLCLKNILKNTDTKK